MNKLLLQLVDEVNSKLEVVVLNNTYAILTRYSKLRCVVVKTKLNLSFYNIHFKQILVDK